MFKIIVATVIVTAGAAVATGAHVEYTKTCFDALVAAPGATASPLCRAAAYTVRLTGDEDEIKQHAGKTLLKGLALEIRGL